MNVDIPNSSPLPHRRVSGVPKLSMSTKVVIIAPSVDPTTLLA